MSDVNWKTLFDGSLKILVPVLTLCLGWVYKDVKDDLRQVEERQFKFQETVVTKADLKESADMQRQIMEARLGEVAAKLDFVIQITKNKQ